MIIRVFVLTLLAFGITTTTRADHLTADCPLSLVGATPAITTFDDSPHGVFQNGSVVYLLRGQNLTTLESTEVGDLVVLREDFLDEMANRDPEGGTVYNNGYLYVSGDAGLETWDLRNVHQNGTSPALVGRIAGAHYRRMAANGNVLAATYPAKDLPCAPNALLGCQNWIDIYSIADPANPVLVRRMMSGTLFIGFQDVAFASNYLYTTTMNGTFGFNVSNPGSPALVLANATVGEFLATNGTGLLAVGQETRVGMFTVRSDGALNFFSVFTLPSIVNRANSLMFHPEAWVSDTRLITMIDEKNPMTGRSARTIAFDVFDFTVPFFEGFDDRIYENVSFTTADERLFNPVAVGPFVYVVGEVSGTQKWGACGMMAGRIQLDSVRSLSCGGAEIHGWVTGEHRIVNVEVFLDGDFLGNANFGSPRHDIVTSNPVMTWRIPVDLDDTPRGDRVLRAVGTDALGNRFQFASAELFFPGPGSNCTSRRRASKRN
ncbi:MAG TPA: hypothetical protein VMS56_04465 [Thermoanaerobaculia bacterium]|nr:hypothetical protein [Thermoanaerobaculia bacterium]